jgi:hypothetical protein
MQTDEALKNVTFEEHIPAFAKIYTKLFGTTIRSVVDRYQSIFAVFKLHMETLKKAFNITQRAQLSPEINEGLVFEVEHKRISLCRECAKSITNGFFCSTACETANSVIDHEPAWKRRRRCA